MTKAESPAAIEGARTSEPWKFWATTGWTAAVLAIWLGVQVLVFALVLVYVGVGDDASAGETQRIFEQDADRKGQPVELANPLAFQRRQVVDGGAVGAQLDGGADRERIGTVG